MNCLLLTPPIFSIIREALLETVSDDSCSFPPLGLLMIAAYAETVSGVSVSVLDTQAEKLSWDTIAERISQAAPDIVGIQVMTFTLIDAYQLAAVVRKVCPQALIVMGGPHPTLYPSETIASPMVDYVIYGEGEFAFKNLLAALLAGDPVQDIPGVVTKDTDTSTLALQYIEDLDALLPPARHLLDMRMYSSSLASTDYVTTMMSSRGCPGKCIFCDRPQMGKRFRKRSAQSVFLEMKECVDKLGIKEITFYDDTFTIDRQRVLDLCALIEKEKLDVQWDIRARIDTMSPEMLKALGRAGCVRIHYGVETGDERLQKHIRKNLDLRSVKQVVLDTKAQNIETLGYFMLGLPTETRHEMNKTIDMMCSLPFDYAHIATFTPYPGTAAYTQALKDGVYMSDYWREFAKNPTPDFVPPFWTEALSASELSALLRKAYRRFYFRPTYLWERLRKVNSASELWKKGRIGLALLKDTLLPSKTA